MLEYDDNWESWKIGDKIVWEDDKILYKGKVPEKLHYTIKSFSSFYPSDIPFHGSYVHWDDPNGGPENTTRVTNVYRVKIVDKD